MDAIRTTFATIVCLAGLLASVPARAAHVALVVGNDAYQNLPKLDKAVADATAYADLLKSQGFEQVVLKTNLARAGMDEAIAGFLDAIKPGDTAVFAYSGHGWSDGAQNYIVGTDAPKAGSQDFLTRISIPLRNGVTGVLDDMDRHGASLKVAIIDACRDNPFQPLGNGRSVGVSRGLSRIDPPQGTFVIFSAGSGQEALDALSNTDPDPNSVFTRIFLPLLRSGLSLRDATIQARQQVVALAKSVGRDQLPAYYDEALGDTFLTDASRLQAAAGGAPQGQPQPQLSAEIAFWNSIQSSTDLADFQAYLSQFPNGTFATLARNRLALLSPPVQMQPVGAGPQARPAVAACSGVLAAIGNAGQQCLRPKDAFRDCDAVCPNMVVIPAGSFVMGSPASEPDHQDAEAPAHTVTIKASFAVGELAISRGEFAAFVRDSGYQLGASCYTLNPDGSFTNTPGKSFLDPGWFAQTDAHPAICVSWDDAKAYTAWLTKRTGKPYRLLTEAEYEYSARAGTTTAFWFGSDGNAICPYANGADAAARAQFPLWKTIVSCDDGYVYTAPGGSFAANGFGLFDMSGNVWEWTEDCLLHADYAGAPTDGGAWPNESPCSFHVQRGGSFVNDPHALRSAYRAVNSSALRSVNFGFRVARDLRQ